MNFDRFLIVIKQFKKDNKFALVVFGLRLEHRITVKL